MNLQDVLFLTQSLDKADCLFVCLYPIDEATHSEQLETRVHYFPNGLEVVEIKGFI